MDTRRDYTYFIAGEETHVSLQLFWDTFQKTEMLKHRNIIDNGNILWNFFRGGVFLWIEWYGVGGGGEILPP